ncbi:MAG: hypothetical protein ACYTG0_44055 [Planctomycetota bacterium]
MRYAAGGFAAVAFTCLAVGTARADVIEFTDKDEWIAAVGPFDTVDFTGFPDGTFITDQYAHLGVLFTDGNDNIFLNDGAFPNDGAGLDGNGDINVSFDTPQAWIGVDFPGILRIELFANGQLIYTSSDFGVGGPGTGNFAGLFCDEQFDAARLIDPAGEAAIDDLHFGVPSPSPLWLVGLAGFLPVRRRCA